MVTSSILTSLTVNYVFIIEEQLCKSVSQLEYGKKLCKSVSQLEYGKKTLNYSGAALWNSIPGDIKKAQTLRRFKIGLASSLL